MTCGGRSWAGPERGSEILCVLTHGMGSTPPHHHHHHEPSDADTISSIDSYEDDGCDQDEDDDNYEYISEEEGDVSLL